MNLTDNPEAIVEMKRLMRRGFSHKIIGRRLAEEFPELDIISPKELHDLNTSWVKRGLLPMCPTPSLRSHTPDPVSVVAYPEDIQGVVAAFKRLNPGRACEKLGLLFVTDAACERRLGRKGNECDEMYEARTAICRECRGTDTV